MPRLLINPENQIHRLNLIISEVKSLQSLDLSSLTLPSKSKTWSILEIIEHLNIAYSFYHHKIEDILKKAPDTNGKSETFKARRWQQFVIDGQRPKNGKRRWKMKTLKRFEPILSKENLTGQDVKVIFDHFENSYGYLKESILKSRELEVTQTKFSSAIGPIVNFYLPECFEFLICHLERHIVQIENIRKEQG